jgi:hypothetical protein
MAAFEPRIYLGLVHHPIKNKRGEVITTSVTNMDLHDISRSCRTFNVATYYVITPLPEQQKLVSRILGHWNLDKSNDYNPDRVSALSPVVVKDSLEESVADIKQQTSESRPLKLVVTGANLKTHQGNARQLWEQAVFDKSDIFLIFGTGWGLDQQIVDQANFCLEPLYGSAADGYNHLSVRSAVAIYTHQLGQLAVEGRRLGQ